MGQDGEDGESRARRDEAVALAERIEHDRLTLDPVWTERFEQDVAKDAANEDMLLLKSWCIAVAVLFLVLMQRLFS